MKVSVFAPATVANLSCGFDVLGLAIEKPGDVVHVSLSETSGVEVTSISGDDGKLPLDNESNSAGASVVELLKHLNKPELGFKIQIEKQMPLGSGLGSSAASAVAAVVAANELLGNPFTRAQLLPFAMEGERAACGSAIADNAGACLLGGIVLIRSYNPLDIISLPVPQDLWVSVIHPHLVVSTRDAREILEKEILLTKAVEQWGNLGGFISGLYTDNFELIGRSLKDVLIEPLRSRLITGFHQVQNAAITSGALGSGISGSGPSVFALSKGEETANKTSEAMRLAYLSLGIENEIYTCKVNTRGAVII